MKKILILTVSLFFFSSCTGPSVSKMGAIGLLSTPAVAFFSYGILLMISRILISKDIILEKHYKFQFILFFVFSLLMNLLLHLNGSYLFEHLRYLLTNSVLAVIVIPYIIFYSVLGFTFLSKKHLKYLYSLLMGIYYISAVIMYVTNDDVFIFLNPVLILYYSWFISIPLTTILIIYNLRKKKKKNN